MDTQPGTHPDQAPAVEFLARETNSRIDDVEQMYMDEMAKLAIGARINNFLSIFAIRNVRELLIARGVANPVPV